MTIALSYAATARTAGDIPDGIHKVLFAWERGSKLFVTDAEQVNPNT